MVIARLVGKLIVKQPPFLVVDVQGVGYELEAPMTTIYQLPEVGQEVKLLTHLAIREDAHQLYGFISSRDKQLFRDLIKVNGVGPKLALAILSSMDADTFFHCIQRSDAGLLTSIPGIGKKSAERLIIEMKDRLGKMGAESAALSSGLASISAERPRDATQDAIDALVALGYKANDAHKMVKVAHDAYPEGGSETLIKAALQKIMSHKK